MVRSLLLADDALEGELLLDPGEVGGVGVAEARGPSRGGGLVVDSVPDDLVVEAGGDAAADGEGQLAVEGLLEQFEDLVALGRVGQEGGARGAGVGLAVALAGVEVVADDEGALGVSLADHVLVEVDAHLAVGLVAGHVAEDGGADGALGPVLLADEHEEAVAVVLVRAAEHEDVLGRLLETLLLEGPDCELLQADHALLLFHLAARQRELDRVEVADLEHVVVLLPHTQVLLVDHLHQHLDHLEQRVVALHRVLRAQRHLLLARASLLHEELRPLLPLHRDLRNYISKNQATLFLKSDTSQEERGEGPQKGREKRWWMAGRVKIGDNFAGKKTLVSRNRTDDLRITAILYSPPLYR